MIARREFLVRSGQGLALGGWLQVGWCAPDSSDVAAWSPNAVLDLHRDGSITVRVVKSEMGQGVLTALPMLLAEELDLPMSRVHAVLAPGAEVFRDERGNQATGYSSSVSSSFLPLRQLGATARALLIQAAAARWQTETAKLTTADGAVIDPQSGRRLPYGELLNAARNLPAPQPVALKSPADWRLLGTEQPRVDTVSKVDGSAVFGIDVQVPGMLVGVVARSPVPGGQVQSLDARGARRVRGFFRTLAIDAGIVALADNFHAARKARDALKIVWRNPSNVAADTAAMRTRLRATLDQPGTLARRSGAEPAAATGDVAVESEYHTPFLAHAALEPLACTADVRADGCDIWVGTQAPSRAQNWGAQLTGLPRDRVRVHSYLLGGAFGRRGEWDFVVEAVQTSQAARRPVKIVWSREDDMRHDFYRPMTANKLRGRVSAAGAWLSYQHRLACPSIARRRSPDMLERGTDFLMTQGSSDLHYDLPFIDVDYREVDLGVPVGFWRSVGHSHNGFVAESFVDELAHAAKRDPLEFRLAYLSREPRMQGVLLAAARAADWSGARAMNRSLGIACMKAYGTFVAQVAAVRLDGAQIRVTDVWCAVDCGLVVNPLIVRQQMESGIVYGLSAALQGEITHEKGSVMQSNFHDYAVLRIGESPRIHVEIIASRESPGGCGEPSTPVVAPAVANAVFALTGQRLRSLPLRLAGAS